LLLLPLHAGPPPASCTPSLHDALPILLPRLHDHDSLDVAYSLALTRCHHDRRAVAVVGDGELAALEELANGRGTITTTAKPKLALLFTGQGAQRLGMGRPLFDAYPTFRAALEQVCAGFDQLLDRPLRSVMFGEDPEAATLLDQTGFTQPALFAL